MLLGGDRYCKPRTSSRVSATMVRMSCHALSKRRISGSCNKSQGFVGRIIYRADFSRVMSDACFVVLELDDCLMRAV